MQLGCLQGLLPHVWKDVLVQAHDAELWGWVCSAMLLLDLDCEGRLGSWSGLILTDWIDGMAWWRSPREKKYEHVFAILSALMEVILMKRSDKSVRFQWHRSSMEYQHLEPDDHED